MEAGVRSWMEIDEIIIHPSNSIVLNDFDSAAHSWRLGHFCIAILATNKTRYLFIEILYPSLQLIYKLTRSDKQHDYSIDAGCTMFESMEMDNSLNNLRHPRHHCSSSPSVEKILKQPCRRSYMDNIPSPSTNA